MLGHEVYTHTGCRLAGVPCTTQLKSSPFKKDCRFLGQVWSAVLLRGRRRESPCTPGPHMRGSPTSNIPADGAFARVHDPALTRHHHPESTRGIRVPLAAGCSAGLDRCTTALFLEDPVTHLALQNRTYVIGPCAGGTWVCGGLPEAPAVGEGPGSCPMLQARGCSG